MFVNFLKNKYDSYIIGLYAVSAIFQPYNGEFIFEKYLNKSTSLIEYPKVKVLKHVVHKSRILIVRS